MCSTIILGADSKKLLAENYDFNLDHGYLGVNLKGTIKENGRELGEKVLRWQVSYGSVTFNQYSFELPISGMNEAGLAIALMFHDEGNAGTNDAYARLSALQWIQYQLDNSKDIDDVIHSLEKIRPKQDFMPLHYSLLDAQGNSLLLEFINEEEKCFKNPSVPTLTNSSYERSLDDVQYT